MKPVFFYELNQKGFFLEKQKILPVKYKEIELEVCYRIDLLVENQVLIELKSVKEILPIHSAQLLSYLKISNLEIGLLFNFNETKLVDGMKRIINS